MSFTPITKSQWDSIGKVFLYIAGSSLVAAAVVLLTNNPIFVTLMPAINMLAVIVQKLLTDAENAAVANLPVGSQAVVTEVSAIATQAAVTAVTNPAAVVPQAVDSAQAAIQASITPSL